MGITNSKTNISIEDLKDQIFGISIYLLSKQYNNCNYTSNPIQINDLPEIINDENFYTSLINYYNYKYNDYNNNNIIHIDNYVKNNILISEEKYNEFIKVLIEKLLLIENTLDDTIITSSELNDISDDDEFKENLIKTYK